MNSQIKDFLALLMGPVVGCLLSYIILVPMGNPPTLVIYVGLMLVLVGVLQGYRRALRIERLWSAEQTKRLKEREQELARRLKPYAAAADVSEDYPWACLMEALRTHLRDNFSRDQKINAIIRRQCEEWSRNRPEIMEAQDQMGFAYHQPHSWAGIIGLGAPEKSQYPTRMATANALKEKEAAAEETIREILNSLLDTDLEDVFMVCVEYDRIGDLPKVCCEIPDLKVV